MLEFFKTNKFISMAVGVLFLLIVIIFILFLKPVEKEIPSEQAPDQVFGDFGGKHEFASSSQNIFANPGEQWIEQQDGGAPASTLRALTKMPVAGAAVFDKMENEIPVAYVRFTGYTNGHVYETAIARVMPEEKLSAETLIRIGDSLWSKNGGLTVTRYYDEDRIGVRARLIDFRATSTEDGVEKSYLEKDLAGNIVDLVFSPDASRIFYLVKTTLGTVGYIENIKTGASKEVWSSLLTSVHVNWGHEDTILVYTNPTSIAEGAVWAVNPDTGKEKVVLSRQVALAPKMSPDGEKILFSMQETGNKLFTLEVLNMVTNKTTKLPLATMVEKCAWSTQGSRYVYCAVPNAQKGGSFMEDWYMGIEQTEDTLWRIDTEAGVVKKLLDPFEEVGETFDIIDIVVSPQENYLVFRTRKDSVLWSFTLPQKETPPDTDG